MAKTALRKNSKARSWISKKISIFRREGMPEKQAVAAALSIARQHKLINPSEEAELEQELGTEDEAEELARGFHGRENRETLDIVETESYRENLAILGEMVELEVFIESRSDEGLVPICFSREVQEDIVYLGSSPDRKQLYLTGDTGLPDDWLQEASPESWGKDKVPIGYVYSVSYFADKHHLTGGGGQEFGTEYIHCFGEQTFEHKGKGDKVFKLEEKIVAGLLPMLVYDRLGERMELVGGGYDVRDEGIWD